MIVPRAHQRIAVNKIYDAWGSGALRNPLVVAPTASGKSVMLAMICAEALQAYPNTRIIMATHVQELIAQNGERLMQMWPNAPLGYYSAGLKQKDAHSPIVFGGIQSMVGKEYELQGADILLIDEAHLLSPNAQSSYRKFIDKMLTIRPSMKIAGFTATPYRMDSGPLVGGKDTLFDGIAHEIGIQELLDAGLLSPLVTYSTQARIDTTGIKKQGGEYVTAALQAAIDTGDISARIVKEACALGENRGHWLAFCVGVDHALHMRDLMRDAGVSCEMISGETPKAERERTIAAFKAGRVKCLTNANVLTTGFDAPLIDFLILARPTLSPGLYCQMLGRGMRTADGKQNCMVADFAGNIFEHGPVDKIRPPKHKGEKAGGGLPPVKACPSCDLVIPVQQIKCDCGHEWPRDYLRKLQAEAAEASFVANTEPPRWYSVTGVKYHSVRNKADTHNMLRVEYQCGFTLTVSELVLIEHDESRQRAEAWWLRRSKTGIIPGTVQAALHIAVDLEKPKAILSQKVGKYLNVVDYSFNGAP